MKIGDRVIGTVKSPASGGGNPGEVDLKPTGPIVDISGANSEFLHVYTQYGAVWRIPVVDCVPA